MKDDNKKKPLINKKDHPFEGGLISCIGVDRGAFLFDLSVVTIRMRRFLCL